MAPEINYLKRKRRESPYRSHVCGMVDSCPPDTERPRVIVHFIRHAECENQKNKGHLVDPVLNQLGICQADHFRENFEPMQRITHVIVSPMKRALQTDQAHLAFHPLQTEGLRLVVWPSLRSLGTSNSSHGSSTLDLESFINGRDIDLSALERGWEKITKRGSAEKARKAREVVFNLWDLGRQETEKRCNPSLKRLPFYPNSRERYGSRESNGRDIEIAVVTHGSFMDEIHKHVTGKETETYHNLQYRTYEFTSHSLFETKESKTRKWCAFDDDFLDYVDRRYTQRLSLHPEHDIIHWANIRQVIPSVEASLSKPRGWYSDKSIIAALETAIKGDPGAQVRAKTTDSGIQVGATTANAGMRPREKKTEYSCVQTEAPTIDASTQTLKSETKDSGVQVGSTTADFTTQTPKNKTKDSSVQVGGMTVDSGVQVGGTTAHFTTQTPKHTTKDSSVQVGGMTVDSGVQVGGTTAHFTTQTPKHKTKDSSVQVGAMTVDSGVQVGGTTTDSSTRTAFPFEGMETLESGN